MTDISPPKLVQQCIPQPIPGKTVIAATERQDFFDLINHIKSAVVPLSELSMAIGRNCCYSHDRFSAYRSLVSKSNGKCRLSWKSQDQILTARNAEIQRVPVLMRVSLDMP